MLSILCFTLDVFAANDWTLARRASAFIVCKLLPSSARESNAIANSTSSVMDFWPSRYALSSAFAKPVALDHVSSDLQTHLWPFGPPTSSPYSVSFTKYTLNIAVLSIVLVAVFDTRRS